jgi:hypothetical protein
MRVRGDTLPARCGHASVLSYRCGFTTMTCIILVSHQVSVGMLYRAIHVQIVHVATV